MLAAWKKRTKSGEEYISIALGDNIKVVMDGETYGKGDWIQIWSNKRKFSEKHPDYLLLKKEGGNYSPKYTKNLTTDSGEHKSESDRLLDEVEEALR